MGEAYSSPGPPVAGLIDIQQSSARLLHLSGTGDAGGEGAAAAFRGSGSASTTPLLYGVPAVAGSASGR